MQRQIYMLNLFVEFRFQLFNMKTLFDFKLRISAGMIDNLKTRNITLIPATFRGTKIFKNVGIFVPKEMLINTCVKMLIDFTNITSSTAPQLSTMFSPKDFVPDSLKSRVVYQLTCDD